MVIETKEFTHRRLPESVLIPAPTHNCFVATNTFRILNSCRSLIHTEHLMSIKWIEAQFNDSVSKNKTAKQSKNIRGLERWSST